MKTINRIISKIPTKNIVAIKVMAFLSWLIYLGIAFANNIMIEAFIFSVALVIIGYILFGRKSSTGQQKLAINNKVSNSDDSVSSYHYLAIFFHSTNS